jgi:RNA polymerase sigma factor (TIGR02999 family)
VNFNSPPDVTQILQNWGKGDTADPEKLMPLVYEELRRLARSYLAGERCDHTLQATALVHESYLRLVGETQISWKDRAHFYGIAARLMRRVLVDHARVHNAEKRGGKLEKVYLDETKELLQESPPDLVALDDALESFAVTFPRESQVVEMKFFAGMEGREIAEMLDVSAKTVARDWHFAKTWLRRELRTNATYA